MAAIDEKEFAQECVFRGLFFGVNAHYLLGSAKLRSNIDDAVVGDRTGPFRLSKVEWGANSSNLNFGLKYTPEQITSWRRQCGVYGFMTYNAQNELHLKLDRFPSAIELYQKQWGVDANPAQFVANFKAALDATADLIGPAAQAVLDDPADVDDVLINTGDSTKTKLPNFGGGLFETKAPRIMRQLMDDFGFSKIQAAGILGNLGHETGGFRHFQEINPLGGGAGGFGWAQWTGMKIGPPPGRRRAFQDFCQASNVSMTSDEGNYGFLKHELKTTEKATAPAMKNQTTLQGATETFETKFERAGVVALESRMKFARKALAAFEAQTPP